LESDSTGQLIIFFVLLILSAFFSASETALTTLSKIRMRQMVEDGVDGSETVNKLLQNPSRVLTTVLIGNNIVNISASSLATSLAIQYFGNNGVGIAVGIATFLILIFGEIIPKSIASKNSEKISLKVAKAIYFCSILLMPITKILSYITSFIFKTNGNITPFITEAELKTMVDFSHSEGVIEVGEREMIQNIFEFNDTFVKAAMIQRTNMIAIEQNTTYEEIIRLFKKEKYSRMPVYDRTIDNIIGVLNVKDLLFIDFNSEVFSLKQHIRTPYFTFEFKKTDDLFAEMRKNQISLAIVTDEYGGTSGIITLEDLIEEIVGEIEDEYDEIINEISVVKEDEYIISGIAKIDLVNEMIGTNIESKDADTLGGFIIDELGRFPNQGETIEYNEIKFIIQDMDRMKIKKIKVLT